MPASAQLFLPECPEVTGGLPCWLCKSCGGQVHPVDAYRCWDHMWGPGNYGTRAHWSTVWLLASPFLRDHGYELDLELVDIPKHGKRLVTPHDRYHSFMNELGVLVCPARKGGSDVFIKALNMRIDSNEYPINQLLNSAECRSDSRNHTIPVLDILHFQPMFQQFGCDTSPNDARAFVVMPKVYPLACHEPFNLYGERIPDIRNCIEFAAQTAEGLEFMHELGVFHGDISEDNFVSSCSSSGQRIYYYIDFQGSGYFPRPWKEPPRMLAAFPSHQRYPFPFGLSATVPNDPFAADVFALGLLFRSMYNGVPNCEKHFNIVPGFVNLIDQMCVEIPERRLSAVEASTRAAELLSSISTAARVPCTDLSNMPEAQRGTITSKLHIVE